MRYQRAVGKLRLLDRLRLSKGGFEYWDTDWRREHRGMGRYPENELWEAVEGYLDILSASRAMPRNAPPLPPPHMSGDLEALTCRGG